MLDLGDQLVQLEEFGREMYKLFKVFNSKSKDRQDTLGGGVKRDSEPKLDFAPRKMAADVQESIKQFKVNIYIHSVLKNKLSILCTCLAQLFIFIPSTCLYIVNDGVKMLHWEFKLDHKC